MLENREPCCCILTTEIIPKPYILLKNTILSHSSSYGTFLLMQSNIVIVEIEEICN